MNEQDLIELTIDVSAADASREDIDHITRGLLQELKRSDAESVELAEGGAAPQGSKSAEAEALGSLIVSGAPIVINAVIEFAKAWSALGAGRTVKFKGKVKGQVIEFEGRAKDLETILARLDRRRKT
jgi:hypothetical protein